MSSEVNSDCKQRFDKIETRLNAIGNKVFNGYGENIQQTRDRVESIEKKLNWFFATFTGLLISVILLLGSMVV